MKISTLSVPAATALLLLVLSGCKSPEYTYTPPTTPEGAACSGRCADAEAGCDARAEQQAQQENSRCQAAAARSYAECTEHSSNPGKCYMGYCSQTAYTTGCRREWEACFKKCGGTITEKK